VTRVVPHEELMNAARSLAERILANDQAAVRSAKQTTLDVIGRQLDDKLRLEALNGYSVAPRGQEVLAAFSAE
jgi:enoyl-CoA hydratase/carnithine racemase